MDSGLQAQALHILVGDGLATLQFKVERAVAGHADLEDVTAIGGAAHHVAAHLVQNNRLAVAEQARGRAIGHVQGVATNDRAARTVRTVHRCSRCQEGRRKAGTGRVRCRTDRVGILRGQRDASSVVNGFPATD